jgi:hypothetical protein
VNVNTLEHEEATRLDMNDIASVEFEAHVPLFFDPYATNRATGSFILIDPISNATVGAGMIQEDLPGEQRQERHEVASPANVWKRVSALQRYERHGHYPATFLLEDQPALASRLELALFQRGFEVLHFDDNEVSPHKVRHALHVAHSIGAIVIYSGHSLDSEPMQLLPGEGRPPSFEVSRPSEHLNDEHLLKRALAFADSLRLTKPESNQEEVH